MWCVVLCAGQPVSIRAARPMRYTCTNSSTGRQEMDEVWVSGSLNVLKERVNQIIRSHWSSSNPYAYVFTEDPLDPVIPILLTAALAQIYDSKLEELMEEIGRLKEKCTAVVGFDLDTNIPSDFLLRSEL